MFFSVKRGGVPSGPRRGLHAAVLALALGSAGEVACGAALSFPADCVPDPARAGRVVEALAGIADAEVLLSDDTRAHICFSPGPGTLRVGGIFALPDDTSDDEAAARLVHLLHHVRHGRGLVTLAAPDRTDCDARVREALEDEAAAHVLEMQVRASLGVEQPVRPFANAAEVLAARREERVGIVLAFLTAHPDGGGGYEALGRDYRERCGGR